MFFRKKGTKTILLQASGQRVGRDPRIQATKECKSARRQALHSAPMPIVLSTKHKASSETVLLLGTFALFGFFHRDLAKLNFGEKRRT